MSIAKYNKGSKFTNIPDTTNFEVLKTKEAYEKYGSAIIRLHGLFISKAQWHYPIAITKNEFILLPLHMTDTIDDILCEEEAIDQINNGFAAIKMTTWEDKNNDLHYSAEFVDL